MNLRSLLSKRVTREFEFLGETVTLSKLSLNELEEFQKFVKTINDDKKLTDAERYKRLQHRIIVISMPEDADLTIEELGKFPPTDLALLAKDALEFNGLSGEVPRDEEGNAPTDSQTNASPSTNSPTSSEDQSTS